MKFCEVVVKCGRTIKEYRMSNSCETNDKVDYQSGSIFTPVALAHRTPQLPITQHKKGNKNRPSRINKALLAPSRNRAIVNVIRSFDNTTRKCFSKNTFISRFSLFFKKKKRL